MARAKKFGTFSGVFTPSILTILGVIMYLRLPTIVGQAGLFAAVGIIVVAHIISISTGLSVASIATDKKVKAGGTYYMISRSLGLPIGGTLGLALFVGLSFSVSLYLIGFAESFLGYWGFIVSKNTIRLAGTITLFAVTGVTLISTALALRTQFYIMAAIALSLLSILFGRHEFAPSQPLLSAVPDAAPFIVLFGIFFPAVTGFEAGVSMSGDLKDPKRSIPVGTISAIAVGFVVYIALAVYFSYTVMPEQLSGNPNVLLDIALFPPLVVAGIWGATISSAFGSILGAPRILQATSVDRITPKFFARGYGAENEPRHALLLTFAIAEAGILIGELDVIARIVSMFFITTYGFLNLSAAIENWASPDFRPEFRVPTFVGIIGSLACFIVMIQLDFVAMVGATVILGGVYLYLARKQLTLESGDTWEGFWSSIVRSGLQRLSRGGSHVRNWRPNILLFSGRPETRADLIEFGRQLVHRRGVLTSFELTEGDGPREPVTAPDPDEEPYGVFHRRAACDNVFDGIESIARYHGYAGVEPNTVLLAWTRGSRDPRRFVLLIQALARMDHNILLMDYDQERGFGTCDRIDVWLRGEDRNLGLALALLRFLSTTDSWRNAKLRFLALNEHDAAHGMALHRTLLRVLTESRVAGDVRIIDHAGDTRPFAAIVRQESIDADLSILGLDDIGEQSAAAFVAETQRIVDDLGSVLLVRASSFFEAPFSRPELIHSPSPHRTEASPEDLPAETAPARTRDETLAPLAARVDDAILTSVRDVLDAPLRRAFATQRVALQELAAAIQDAAQRLARTGSTDRHAIDRIRRAFLTDVLDRWTRTAATFEAPRDDLTAALTEHERNVRATIDDAPGVVTIVPDAGRFAPDPADPPHLRRSKTRRRLAGRLLRRAPRYTVRWQRLLEHTLLPEHTQALCTALGWLSVDGRQAAEQARDAMLAVLDVFERLERDAPNDTPDADAASLMQPVGALLAAHRETEASALAALHDGTRQTIEAVTDRAARLDADRSTRRVRPARRLAAHRFGDAGSSPEAWAASIELFLADAILTARLRLLEATISGAVARTTAKVNAVIGDAVARLRGVREEIDRFERAGDEADGLASLTDLSFPLAVNEIVQTLRATLRETVATLPEEVAVPDEESLGRIAEHPLGGVEPAQIQLRRFADYVLETEFLGPLETELAAAEATLQNAAEVAREVIRLTIFTVGDARRDDSAVTSGIERIDEQVCILEQAAETVMQAVERKFTDAFARLEPAVLLRSGQSDGGLRARRGRDVASRFSRLTATLRRAVRDRVADLVYQRSEGLLLARELRSRSITRRTTGDALLELTRSLSPRPEVLDALPFYYRQLFLGKPTMTRDFWIGWANERALARRAVDHYRSGRPGALLIVGEPESGRTSLSYHIAESFFSAHAIRRVDPPEGGSIDPATFATRFQRALGMSGSPESLVRALPRDSVIILDDFGLWWERSEDGFGVVEQILELLARNADRCMFILNANVHTFRLMNRIRMIEDHFVSVITLEPFTAREIRDVIMLRHQSTGLAFELGGAAEEQISELRLARLFNDYFDYSGGVLGAALQAWIVHIKGIQDDRLQIAAPERPRLDTLDGLDAAQTVLLLQFLVHEQLTMERLARLAGPHAEALAREALVLQRAGVIGRGPSGGLEIDPFLRPHLARYLHDREML